MKRKCCCVLTVILIMMCFSVPTYAAEFTDEIGIKGSVDIKNLEEDPDIIISEPLTYDEMIYRYAQNADISIEEARKQFPEYPKNSGARGTDSVEYRELSKYLDVTSEYRPRLVFFCEIAQGTSTFNILSIYEVQLDRGYNNPTTGTEIVKQFEGELNAWLRGVWEIEYFINGNFYNFGTTTITGGVGVNAGEDEKITVGFNASMAYDTNYYGYIYEHEFMTYFH
ncbi:MAG: hypothetical protein IKU09_01970 [Firmicutes bacterium]|nr:hypothetical protein [Bacillota bacterium]